MDSHESDELRQRRRGEALARRMGDALDRAAFHEAVGDCPEADVIAAYHDRALAPEEIALCEDHFAGCSRCRKILAVLAASVDAPLTQAEVARLGEMVRSASLAADKPASQKVTPIRSVGWDWRSRWLAPALGVAAVLAVWFAMRPPWRANEQQSTDTLIAQAPKNELRRQTNLRTPDPLSMEKPGKNERADATPPKNQPAPRTLPVNPEPNPLARRDVADSRPAVKIGPIAGVANGTVRDKEKNQDESNTATAMAPSPAPPPQGQGPAALATPDATEMPKATSQSVIVTGEAPVVSTTLTAPSDKPAARSTSNLPLNGRNYQRLSTLSTASGAAIQINTPSRTILWRAGINGSIQRSSDAGGTWVLQESPLQEDWLAGSAVSDTACWLVGRNGAIARTTDGERWEKISPPSRSADASRKFPDWIGVTTRNMQVATITASNGQRFATRDGGRTWQSQ